MVRNTYSHKRKIFYAPLLTLIALAVSLAFMAPQANAVSQLEKLKFIGDNPSGKLGKDGKPLISTLHDTAAPSRKSTSQSSTAFEAECPKTITCKVVPAAYVANGGNVEDYGNYDIANRPNDMKIDKIVIHDTEGSLASVLEAFQDPTFYASAHYVIDRDGTVYQMVPTKDIAWHAGNWSYNMHSIGIEHVGYAGDSSSYTSAMYKASTQLVKYLANKFDIPKDREHIIGHDNIPGTNPTTAAQQHTDPGPFWNWQKYMTMIGSPVVPTSHDDASVTIAPIWQLNKQAVTGCSNGVNGCVPAGAQPTNFVSLYTEPRQDAPLFNDGITGQGTMDVNNNSSRVFYGQTFAVADKLYTQNSVWYQIWVNGQKAWFLSSRTNPTAVPTSAKYVTPKQDNTPVYGRAIPERSEYPSDLIATAPGSFYVPTPTPLTYTMQKGQKYTLIGKAKTEHFYAWASDASFPYDHTVFKGATEYVEVQLGNRSAFVKKSDIVIK
jgi:hypothetical protein